MNKERSKTGTEIFVEKVTSVPPKKEKVREPLSVRIADKVAAYAGSVPFFFLNLVWFVGWIIANTIFPSVMHFDPYPFQFLTMAVSLEAIFLSIFVLISENRQAAKDREMLEKDFETNQKAEQENIVLLAQVKHIEDLAIAIYEQVTTQELMKLKDNAEHIEQLLRQLEDEIK